MDNSLYSSNQMSSPFKGDFNKAAERSPDYEPYHSRSSFNLNYSTSTPVPKMDRETMYSADLLVRKITCNASLSSSTTDTSLLLPRTTFSH